MRNFRRTGNSRHERAFRAARKYSEHSRLCKLLSSIVRNKAKERRRRKKKRKYSREKKANKKRTEKKETERVMKFASSIRASLPTERKTAPILFLGIRWIVPLTQECPRASLVRYLFIAVIVLRIVKLEGKKWQGKSTQFRLKWQEDFETMANESEWIV